MSIVLVRHGQTEWSREGRHTSVTDLPLTDVGEDDARAVAPRLAGRAFGLVLTSPLQRARRTAELAGFPAAEVDPDLTEWAYGDYEGITTEQIRRTDPGWTIWSHPTPGGESADDVAARVDRVLDRARTALTAGEDVLLVAHGHLLRVLGARWLGLPPQDGRHLRLDTATVSELGYERESAVLERWNA